MFFNGIWIWVVSIDSIIRILKKKLNIILKKIFGYYLKIVFI